MEKEFRFEKESHTYWLDGKEIPSFSEIVRPLGGYENVPAHILAAKAEEGTNIHETIRLHLEGTLDESSLDDGNKIALDLFVDWLTNSKFGKLVAVETPTYHGKLKYGTTPDLVFDEAIVDIKTRPFNKTKDHIQLIAQRKCFPDFPEKELFILHLNIIETKYTLVRAEHRQAWAMFRMLLDMHKKNKEWERKIEQWKKQ